MQDSATPATTALVVVGFDAHIIAAGVWKDRRRVELDAAARFDGIAARLETLGGHPSVHALCLEAAEDERRHAVLCSELVHHFGEVVDDVAPLPSVCSVSRPGHTAREALHYEIVALSCVTETLSTALLGELVEQATDDVAKEAMREILRDEVQHSRLGWAHLAAERSVVTRDVVGPHLDVMLRATVHDALFDTGPEHPAQLALTGIGSLPKSQRASIVAEALSEVVFPGLRKFAIDTRRGEAWLAGLMRTH